jgi:hypothetical protein
LAGGAEFDDCYGDLIGWRGFLCLCPGPAEVDVCGADFIGWTGFFCP